MKLSRKDYETFAETIRRLPADPTREAVALAFADLFQGTNPGYDRSRFFAAATRPLDGTVLMEGTRYPVPTRDTRTIDDLTNVTPAHSPHTGVSLSGSEFRERYYG